MRHYRASRPVVPCSSCGETRLIYARGMCLFCYNAGGAARPRRSDATVPQMLTERSAEIPRFGDPRLPPRFWEKVKILDTGCWEWQGALRSGGYGAFRVHPGTNGKMAAHRAAYLALVGPIPDGLELDHTCHTFDLTCYEGADCPHRRCCNPLTLQLVTRRINNRRRHVRRRPPAMFCKWGHPYFGPNLSIKPDGRRRCKECERRQSFERYHR